MSRVIERPRVLFVCTYFGVRSIIARGYAERLSRGALEAHCAGFEHGEVPPAARGIIEEVGLFAGITPPNTVFERHKRQETFDHVITLCDASSAEQCPVFRTCIDAMYAEDAARHHWSVPDFRSIDGSGEAWVVGAREIRTRIQKYVVAFLKTIGIEPVLDG